MNERVIFLGVLFLAASAGALAVHGQPEQTEPRTYMLVRFIDGNEYARALNLTLDTCVNWQDITNEDVCMEQF